MVGFVWQIAPIYKKNIVLAKRMFIGMGPMRIVHDLAYD